MFLATKNTNLTLLFLFLVLHIHEKNHVGFTKPLYSYKNVDYSSYDDSESDE